MRYDTLLLRLVPVVVLLLRSGDAAAQPLVLKRVVPPIAWAGCPAATSASAPADRLAAARLSEAARQSAILGDNETAHQQLAQAVALDPAAPDLVYRLALTLEQIERPRDAAAALCRYLALRPRAADAAEVRLHISDLVATAGPGISANAARAFEEGVAAFDAGRLDEANVAFARARIHEPGWAEPAYNLAAVHFAAGRTDAALEALRVYMDNNPAADDFNRVLDLVLAAQPAPLRVYDTGLTLAGGLIVPGLGHFMTARPAVGTVVLGSAAAALAAALSLTRVKIACLAPPIDGVCAPEQILERRSERPYFTTGFAAAAAIGVFGALDAYLGARRRNAQAAPLSPDAGATDRRAPEVRLPAVRGGRGGVELELLRVRF